MQRIKHILSMYLFNVVCVYIYIYIYYLYIYIYLFIYLGCRICYFCVLHAIYSIYIRGLLHATKGLTIGTSCLSFLNYPVAFARRHAVSSHSWAFAIHESKTEGRKTRRVPRLTDYSKSGPLVIPRSRSSTGH